MKTRKDVRDLIDLIATRNSSCTNATVLHRLFNTATATNSRKKQKNSLPYTAVAESLISSFFSFTSDTNKPCIQKLKGYILSLHSQYLKLVKLPERYCSEITTLLETNFKFPVNTQVSSSSLEIQTRPTSSTGPTLLTSPVKSNANVRTNLFHASPLKTRNKCGNETCQSVKKANISLNESVKYQKRRLAALRKNAAAVKKLYKTRTVNQKDKRRKERISGLNATITSLQQQLQSLKKQNNNLQEENSRLLKDNRQLLKDLVKCQRERDTTNINFKNSEKEVKCSQKYIDYLESIIHGDGEFNNSKPQSFKKGKMYSIDIRKCVYRQLVLDVPVVNCGSLLRELGTFFLGQELNEAPSPATCAQMAYELGILSSVQVVEFLLHQSPLCLSWDATTIDGAHINEIHVTANKSAIMCLDVRHLPGGKAIDYVTHIVETLAEVATVYAKFHNLSYDEILQKVRSNITCTLTDRAAVNAVVTRQLREELQSQLVQLNCNVHPLDSVSRCTQEALTRLDTKHEITGQCLGSNGSAANLIQALSVLRFKDGTGDPAGFKAFLRKNGLPIGTFVRYVGNRLHVLFHLAGLTILHLEKLQSFIKDTCTAGGLLRSRLIKDLENPKIIVQVWVLGMLGKVFSGVWMRKFYSSEMSNLAMGPFIRCCMDQIAVWIESPGDFLHPTSDVFGDSVEESDDVLSALLTFTTDEMDLQLEAIEVVLTAVSQVLKRQLSDFISGDFVSPSEELLSSTACAPTNNIGSERNLGLLDNLWRRAPNATAGFLNGKVKAKMNQTLQWLESKSDEEQESLITFVVSAAREERARNVQHRRMVSDRITARREEVTDDREKKKLNKLVKDIKKALGSGDFSSVAADKYILQRLVAFHADPTSVIGQLTVQSVDGLDWYGRITNVRIDPKKITCPKQSLSVSLWSMQEAEANSVDHKMCPALFYANAIMGRILFL